LFGLAGRFQARAEPVSPSGAWGQNMPNRPKVIAFNVDSESLLSLRQAFPDGEIGMIDGTTSGSLLSDQDFAAVDLLVLGARDQVVDTLELCRSLRSQAGLAQTPLLVLVQPAQEAVVRAALAAGASSCLVLPVHAKELVVMVNRVRAGNQPGRHTLDLHHAQSEDQWRDHGGEA
jgi:CheY-like chemotaxis protein